MKHIQLFEEFVNEAKTDLVKYVKDASKKIFAKGGNGQNVLDNCLDLAEYIDGAQKPGDDDWYGPVTVSLFMDLINNMGLDDIEHNNISGEKSSKKPEVFTGASDLVALTKDSIKLAKNGGGNVSGWDKAALELAGHLDSYKAGADNPGPGEDGFYTAPTLRIFTRLIGDIAMENIKNNKASESKSNESLEEQFINESAYSERKSALMLKQSGLSTRKKDLSTKISELNKKPKTPKISIQIQIANLKIASLDVEAKKIKLDLSILELSNKLSNL